MGAVLAAVSPAVVVPKMVQLMESGYGTNKCISQLILAGASLDDVFVIVLFSVFVGMAQGKSVNIMQLTQIPVSIFSGFILGVLVGLILSWLFRIAHDIKQSIRNSVKAIVVLASAFLLIGIEEWAKSFMAISGLLAVMSMACTIQLKCTPSVSAALSHKYGKIWIAAEVILFVLVGAAVDIRYTLQAGGVAVILILLALVFRSLGVLVCLVKTPLDFKEKLFCVIAYIPKATVQAAIGSVPLSLGIPCGNLVLSVAVLSILITAPLGAFGLEASYQKLLCTTQERHP